MDKLNFLGFTDAELTFLRNATVHRPMAGRENREEHVAALSAMAKLSLSLAGPADTQMAHQVLKDVVFANRKSHSDLIPGLSLELAKKHPMRTNGHTFFTVFPDQSMLAWNRVEGYGHPGN